MQVKPKYAFDTGRFQSFDWKTVSDMGLLLGLGVRIRSFILLMGESVVIFRVMQKEKRSVLECDQILAFVCLFVQTNHLLLQSRYFLCAKTA